MRRTIPLLILVVGLCAASGYAQLRPFLIRYVSSDVVYLQGGAAAGLKAGMHLTVKRPKPGEAALMAPSVAELTVISVASTSAACEITSASVLLVAGDQAFIPPDELDERPATPLDEEIFTQIVEFADNSPLEEELRAQVPKPPLREVNRFGGRIGFDQDSILDRSGAGQNSSQQGVTFRFDYTRIGNTHWNLNGYWRARLSSRKRPVQQETLTDVMQRVYEFGLRYDNSESRFVLGVGRLMVPWASSLSTLDGGYLGLKLSKAITVGAFGGSTPDPTAWNYDPRRQLGGAFFNLEQGSFERARHSLTAGVAISRLQWRPERQFLFVENGLLLGRSFSFHHNVEADYRSLDRFASSRTISLTRSSATFRIQPLSRLSVDLSHNYFRVLPTPDERLILTQQVVNLLFQGLNAGARLEFPHGIAVYANAGKSNRSGDANASWNGMTGLSARIPKTGLRAEGRFSRFRGTIGDGIYRSVVLRTGNSSRWRLELEGGDQRLDSPLAPDSRTWYGMGTIDVYVRRFVFGFRGTRYQGNNQKYDQLRGSLDFRF